MQSSRSKIKKSSLDNTSLPIHSLQKDESFISVKQIQHKNPYDFTREHRHTYFEVFFFETGGGNQLIDFVKYPIVKNSCYIVFPGQIHLMNRGKNADGLVIQFNQEIITSTQIKNLFQKMNFNNNATIIFENDSLKFKSIFRTLILLKENTEKNISKISEISLHFLQAILLQSIENKTNENKEMDSNKKILYQFLSLLEEHFTTNHSVNKYASLLNTTEKKLSVLSKKYLGKSPLQIIHARLILETKRILLFETISYKEIAYNLGFDSAGSFSQFIKNKTGYNPSELHAHLVEIHK